MARSLAVVLILCTLLAGCGRTSLQVGGGPGERGVVELTTGPYEFRPGEIVVAEGSVLELRMMNDHPFEHDLRLPDGTATARLAQGESDVVEGRAADRGLDRLVGVANHREAVMELDIVVVDPTPAP